MPDQQGEQFDDQFVQMMKYVDSQVTELREEFKKLKKPVVQIAWTNRIQPGDRVIITVPQDTEWEHVEQIQRQFQPFLGLDVELMVLIGGDVKVVGQSAEEEK